MLIVVVCPRKKQALIILPISPQPSQFPPQTIGFPLIMPPSPQYKSLGASGRSSHIVLLFKISITSDFRPVDPKGCPVVTKSFSGPRIRYILSAKPVWVLKEGWVEPKLGSKLGS